MGSLYWRFLVVQESFCGYLQPIWSTAVGILLLGSCLDLVSVRRPLGNEPVFDAHLRVIVAGGFALSPFPTGMAAASTRTPNAEFLCFDSGSDLGFSLEYLVPKGGRSHYVVVGHFGRRRYLLV